MNGFRLLGMELSKLKEQRGVLFSLIGVLLIPIVYVAVLLSSTWGPYDYLNNLPVAFVNKDQGAVSGENPINVGDDLVADLKKSNTLGWDFVSSEEAQKGLKSQDYYMVIEIPEDFSKKVTTVLDANPQVPELHYIQNEGLNFMAAQVTRSATEKIREQLGNKITETYTRTLFSKFGEITTGFSRADGHKDFRRNDCYQMDASSLKSLTDKQKTFKNCKWCQTAESAGQLLSSIRGGRVHQKLAAGSKSLAQGVDELKAGSTKVLGGLKAANTGSSTLTAGLESKLVPGSEQIANGMTKVTETTKQLSAGSQGLTAGLKAFLAKHPELATDIEFMTLVGTSDAISKGMVQFDQEVQPLKTGAAELAGGITQAAAGSKQVSDGLSQLVAGQTAATVALTNYKLKIKLQMETLPWRLHGQN
jgi:putative membrane protein